MPNALITGITGQDGSYLTELLLGKGYNVYGMVRSLPEKFSFGPLESLRDNLYQVDYLDPASVAEAMEAIRPDEIYHLAGVSFVQADVDHLQGMIDANIKSTVNLLAAALKHASTARFLYASSSEIFGNNKDSRQSEETRFCPVTPYGITKLSSHHMVNHFRSLGLFAANAILFNHESPRRGEQFVTQKIVRGAVKIKLGKQDVLELGNLDAKRDWGYAKDYVEAMWKMLQVSDAQDYVIATGELHSVRDFVQAVFKSLGMDWEKHVIVSEKYVRSGDDRRLCGDSSKAKQELSWTPSLRFEELIDLMVLKELAHWQD